MGAAAPAINFLLERSLTDQFEPVHIDHSEVSDLQVRDDRERKKGQVQERLRQRAAHLLCGGA